ncbi:MAG: 2-oxo-4-hydroxy-4-carboxy-5-ureidoimidazoline decarboxylase [Beijerinckiaceae bacterium]
MTQKQTLDHINTLDLAAFSTLLADVFEHAPWVAEAAYQQRPFATVTALHDAMMAAVRAAPEATQLAFLRGHPELGGKVARAGEMTTDSIAEQGGLGLNRLSDAEFDRFEKLNADYTAKFGFPFIICVRRQTRDAILAQFARRGALSPAAELATALSEIGHITRLRLVAKVDGPGMPKTDGRLSTHVLDTLSGKPAPGVAIKLFEVGESARSLLAQTVTNSDGRTDSPLLSGAPLRAGTYELEFAIGDYFRRKDVPMAEPAFLDVVPLRFGIAEPEGHYHVPLLATPWSYSTYRGS